MASPVSLLWDVGVGVLLVCLSASLSDCGVRACVRMCVALNWGEESSKGLRKDERRGSFSCRESYVTEGGGKAS